MDALIRALHPADRLAIEAFFAAVPEGDRTFFKDDVLAPATLDRWFAGDHARRLVAVEGGEVLAFGAVVPGQAWSSHVGEVRVVVAPGHRRRGLGRAMARQLLLVALDLGLDKVVVEVLADQDATIALFTDLGFYAEALLTDHVRDRNGDLHDLAVLAHPVRSTWSTMLSTGVADAVDG